MAGRTKMERRKSTPVSKAVDSSEAQIGAHPDKEVAAGDLPGMVGGKSRPSKSACMVVASFIATVFGAPISYESVVKTSHWGALLSTLTVVPVAAVIGGSWPRWHRLFAVTEPDGPLDLALCLPAHGAVIGSWVGAWPMPLDWGRPWQEWPVCCTYGAVGGYLLSHLISITWNAVSWLQAHKEDGKKAN